jgi:hypothetical protein
VGHVNDSIGDGVIFQLELKDRNYVLRTSTIGEAEKWMYKLRMLRDEARAASIPEETSLDVSTRDSERTEGRGGNASLSKSPADSNSKKKRPSGEWSKANVETYELSKAKGEERKGACCTMS